MPRRHIDPDIVSNVYPLDSTENSRSFNFHAGYLKNLAKKPTVKAIVVTV